jgi:hypothetical protein
MNKPCANILKAAVFLVLPGVSFAHHSPVDGLGGQWVHAMSDPSYLGVALLAAGALLIVSRLTKAFRRGP